jgi:hypothetical protein
MYNLNQKQMFELMDMPQYYEAFKNGDSSRCGISWDKVFEKLCNLEDKLEANKNRLPSKELCDALKSLNKEEVIIRYIRNVINLPTYIKDKPKNLVTEISYAFMWTETPEGMVYWSDLCDLFEEYKIILPVIVNTNFSIPYRYKFLTNEDILQPHDYFWDPVKKIFTIMDSYSGILPNTSVFIRLINVKEFPPTITPK